MSGAEVARALGVSPSRVSRWETSCGGVHVDDLEKLLDYYRVPAPTRVALLDAARRSVRRGTPRAGSPHDEWLEWTDFVEDATHLRNYESLVVPGLLQTAEYARAIIRETRPELTYAEVDALVSGRMARQGLLTRTKPVILDAVVEEVVLDRPFGDPATHRRQIRHLATVAELPNVSLRIAPTSAGFHSAMSGPFVIVTYAEESGLVMLENKVSTLYLDEDEQVSAFEKTWTALAGRVRGTGETADHLRRRT